MTKYVSAITVLCALSSLSVHGFMTPKPNFCPAAVMDRQQQQRQNKFQPLFNVPQETDADAELSKDAASRAKPPQSFYELQVNSVTAAKKAIADGERLLEVEFPPLPAEVLEMDDVSAYDVSEANLKLAIEFSKSFAVDGKKVTILFPDEAEANIAVDNLAGQRSPYPGVTISSLRRSEEGDDRVVKPEQIFMNLFGGKSGVVKPMDGTDMYVVIVASAQELPDVEELMEQLDEDKIICLYNLKLDILRGDLGAPAFPSKDFQDRFLSRVKPVYYLRTRQYSRSVAQPPYLVNYQGCLFRTYPGQFQTLLDTGKGGYRRVCASDFKPPLGTFKQQLTDALKVDGIIQEESSALNFLRTGYKTTTWWEEERENASDAWRT